MITCGDSDRIIFQDTHGAINTVFLNKGECDTVLDAFFKALENIC